jgi:hypothetical protein
VFLEGAGARRDSLRKSFSPSSAERSSLETLRRSSRDRGWHAVLKRSSGVLKDTQSPRSPSSPASQPKRSTTGWPASSKAYHPGRPAPLGQTAAPGEAPGLAGGATPPRPPGLGIPPGHPDRPLVAPSPLGRARGVAASERRLQRGLHALGYCWKRPRYVLARRDPSEGKGAIKRLIRHVPGGRVVLFEDETILRELPPLRAGWAKGGEQVVVPITGRNRLAPPSTPRLGRSSSKTGLTVGPPHFKHSCATCGALCR